MYSVRFMSRGLDHLGCWTMALDEWRSLDFVLWQLWYELLCAHHRDIIMAQFQPMKTWATNPHILTHLLYFATSKKSAPGRCGSNFKSIVFKLIIPLYRILAGPRTVKSHSVECHSASVMASQHWLGTKPLTEPMLTQIYVVTRLQWKKFNCLISKLHENAQSAALAFLCQ